MIIHELNLWACVSIKNTLSQLLYHLEWLSDHQAFEGHTVLHFESANDLQKHY